MSENRPAPIDVAALDLPALRRICEEAACPPNPEWIIRVIDALAERDAANECALPDRVTVAALIAKAIFKPGDLAKNMAVCLSAADDVLRALAARQKGPTDE